MGAPALGVLAKYSPARAARVSPPPGGAMVPPPAIGVGHAKNRFASPGSVRLCSAQSEEKSRGPTSSYYSSQSPAVLEPSQDQEKLLSVACAISQSEGLPVLSSAALDSKRLECEDSKKGLDILMLRKCIPKQGSLSPADSKVSAAAIGQNKNCPAVLEPSQDQEKLLSVACAISQSERLPVLSSAALDSKRLECEDSKKGLDICVLCHQAADTSVCSRCALRLKMRLLAKDLDAVVGSTPGAGSLSFCICCGGLVGGCHEQHNSHIITLRPIQGLWAAWDNGYQSWSSLFESVQTDKRYAKDVEKPYLLKPLPGRRCEVCSDFVAPSTLFGELVRHCTVECWLSSDTAATHLDWAAALVGQDFGAAANAFCFTCGRGIRRGMPCHDGHVIFSVVTDSAEGPHQLHIPTGHSVARALDSVKDWAGGETHSCPMRRLVVKDQETKRCRRCNTRLLRGEDGRGTCYCCLRCALPVEKKFLPRSLQLRMDSST